MNYSHTALHTSAIIFAVPTVDLTGHPQSHEMNAIHPTQFFLPSQSVSSSALQATSKDKSYNEAGSCVLAGPSKSGKGALLFNAAVKFALSHTSPVLWLATSETSSKPLPPTSSFTALGSGVPRQALDTALQRIHFK